MPVTNLFVYGALMYDEVWNRIVSGDFEHVSGTLSGYRRLAVKKEEYPGLIKGSGSVKGCIWLDVDAANLARLDIFEGEFYERIPAVAIDESGNRIRVNVYHFKNKYQSLLENKDWNVKKFENSGLKKFMTRYFGFERVK